MRLRMVCLAGVAALCAVTPTFAQTITEARFVNPTTAYGHAILGDGIEWSGLMISVAGAADVYIGFSEGGNVFEDIAPRLWDVTGDGTPEVVVVETDPAQGARLSIYRAIDGQIGLLAATPYIGTTRRWLAPIAATDLDGDGAIDIAYIEKPHLDKVLRIWRYADGAITQVAAASGLTNHRIGDNFIQSGLRDCGQGPQMIMASGDWARVVAVSYDGSAIGAVDLGGYTGPASIIAALTC